MTKKLKRIVLLFLLTLIPTIANAQSVVGNTDVTIELPEGANSVVEIYDNTEIYEKIKQSNQDLNSLGVELRNKSIDEIENLQLLDTVESSNGKIELKLDNNKSYLIIDKNNDIDPLVIAEFELTGKALNIIGKPQPKKSLKIKKLVENSDKKETPPSPPKRKNPKMGVGSVVGIGAVLVIAVAGLKVSQKKNNEQ